MSRERCGGGSRAGGVCGGSWGVRDDGRGRAGGAWVPGRSRPLTRTAGGPLS
ncbi:hypothetical protein SSBG_00600 [Streptomyces sp. SPB074]|nr:hypothetical protein SSBG_00600 [Streptomyces sp. SPB074]